MWIGRKRRALGIVYRDHRVQVGGLWDALESWGRMGASRALEMFTVNPKGDSSLDNVASWEGGGFRPADLEATAGQVKDAVLGSFAKAAWSR